MAGTTLWYDHNEQVWKAMTIAKLADIAAASGVNGNPQLGLGTPAVCFEDAGYYEYDGETFKRFG